MDKDINELKNEKKEATQKVRLLKKFVSDVENNIE